MITILGLSETIPESDESVSIFGVLLFTDEHAHVKKALSDENYWKAFDKVSGPRWPVFAIRGKPGKLELPKFKRGTMGFMVPVWNEPSENLEFLKQLELEDTRSLPLLVVFARGDKGEILKREMPLNEDSIESFYLSLKNALNIVARAAEGVDESNRKSGLGAIQAVHMSVDSYERWRRVKSGFGAYQWIKSHLP